MASRSFTFRLGEVERRDDRQLAVIDLGQFQDISDSLQMLDVESEQESRVLPW